MYKVLAGGIACVAAIVSTSIAHADVGIYAKLGTSGYGAGVGAKISDSFRVRAEYNAFSFDPGDNSATNIETDYVTYSTALDLRYGALLLDWHPFSGTFRLTGGVVSNGSELTAQPENGYFFFGNSVYSTSQVNLRAKADFRPVAPYFGIGWGDVAGTERHFSFVADIGLLFQGSPDVKVTANCAATGSNANACNRWLANEEQQIQDDADNYKYWPFLSVGVGYRF